jgi:hypothetical protein
MKHLVNEILMKNSNVKLMTKSVFAIIFIILIVSCNNNSTSTSSESKNLNKEQVLNLMSGIWVNEYNLTAEIDMEQERPFWKDKWGGNHYFEIQAYDLENLTIVAKELGGDGKDLGVTLRLVKLEDDSYALAWKYDGGKLLLCSFVRKLDRQLEK